MEKLRINPEFRDKIPPMTDEQFSGLREDILNDGYIRDPLVVWKEENTLLDGHHRWRVICENWELLKDKYTVDYKTFPDRWAALEWICRNQLNKHNLNDEQITYIRGEMYKARKKSVGNSNKRNADGTFGGNDQLDQNDPNGYHPKSTAEAIARELGVAEPTIKRSEAFHDGIDELRKVSPEAADKVMRGGSGASKKAVSELRRKTEPEIKEFANDIISGNIRQKPAKTTRPAKTDREDLSEINAIIADMADLSTLPEFTIDFLIEDIEANGMEYVSLLRNTLIDRSTLLTAENKPLVAKAIDKIIKEIQKVKELAEG